MVVKDRFNCTWNGGQTAATVMLTSWVGKVNRIIVTEHDGWEHFQYFSLIFYSLRACTNTREWAGAMACYMVATSHYQNQYLFVCSFNVRYSKNADLHFFRFQFQFGGSWAPRHPDTDSTSAVTEVILRSGEILTGVNYWTGNLVDALEFVTNIKTYAKVGGGGGGSGSVSGVEVKFFMGDIKDGFITNLKPLFAECWNNKDIAILLHKNALHSELGLNYFTLFTY